MYYPCDYKLLTNETRLPCGDQWKAEKIGAFWHWPIVRCFIKSDRAGLIIEDSINFHLNGEHWWAVQLRKTNLDIWGHSSGSWTLSYSINYDERQKSDWSGTIYNYSQPLISQTVVSQSIFLHQRIYFRFISFFFLFNSTSVINQSNYFPVTGLSPSTFKKCYIHETTDISK